MNQKALQILEYNKITAQLAEYASSSLGPVAASLFWISEEIILSLQDRDYRCIDQSPSERQHFLFRHNTSDSLKGRLKIGSSLGITESSGNQRPAHGSPPEPQSLRPS